MSTTIPSWCRVGEKCVCIEDDWEPVHSGATRVPMVNEVLTITEVDVGELVGLQFAEIPAVVRSKRYDFSVFWCVTHFRPLITQADDIEAHFVQHLHDRTPARETA